MPIPNLLQEALDNSLKRISELENELAISNKKLEFLANYDKLTELANRSLLFDSLHYFQENGKRYNRKFAIFFIDIINFKDINLTLGHYIGDEVLIYFSKKLRQSFRSGDLISRYSGKKFVIVLENIKSKEECVACCDKLALSLKETVKINNNLIDLKYKIGIAIFPNDADNSILLLQKAEHAMHNAKEDNAIIYLFTS